MQTKAIGNNTPLLTVGLAFVTADLIPRDGGLLPPCIWTCNPETCKRRHPFLGDNVFIAKGHIILAKDICSAANRLLLIASLLEHSRRIPIADAEQLIALRNWHQLIIKGSAIASFLKLFNQICCRTAPPHQQAIRPAYRTQSNRFQFI